LGSAAPGCRRAAQTAAFRHPTIKQFLVATIVLSVCGGQIGVALYFAVPCIIERAAGMPTIVTPFSVILAVGISAAISILFGLCPAARAASLEPIQALRHE